MKKQKEAFYLNQMLRGILASVARLKGATATDYVMDGRKLEETLIEMCLEVIPNAADEHHLDAMFYVTAHPIHGDSLDVQDALFDAAQKGLISRDNPIFQKVRLRIRPEQVSFLLRNLPGDEGFYLSLAQELLSRYEAKAAHISAT